MHILITGGTGALGSAIIEGIDANFTILTRTPIKPNHIKSLTEIPKDCKIDVIINLAGEPLTKKRWSKKEKDIIYSSRIDISHELVSLVERLEAKPKLVISGSAIGYYGYTNTACTEDSNPQDVFISKLCQDWEQAISDVSSSATRLCIIRTGVVLQKNAGMLAKMYLPFKLGLGGRLGNGKQYVSWIHIDDFVTIIKYMMENLDMRGAYNCTAPHPVDNAQFSKLFASTLNRPAIIPMPSFMVKILFGEMADALLLNGQNVIPKKLIESGYTFKYPTLSAALQAIY